ncbi:IS66 family insertion sequence element accessory protein TnpB [Shewanella sp. SR43-8]|uniref:IS66 family insertion sequence element accessory protein TnpB n=1 Tax=Shewanella sp. SR43-8 TaxID=2760938 RepID=UPI00160255D5|nr:IS66 family insertion sequence element accessory protein TnpB [Shewanella sp. SR43-8]
MDGLAALCCYTLADNPCSCLVFVFINRNKIMVRALSYYSSGFWLMTKRLSKGKFVHWPGSKQMIEPFIAKLSRQLLPNYDPVWQKHDLI